MLTTLVVVCGAAVIGAAPALVLAGAALVRRLSAERAEQAQSARPAEITDDEIAAVLFWRNQAPRCEPGRAIAMRERLPVAGEFVRWQN